MMKIQKIIECVPNFSEGRDKKICEEIANAIKTVEGINFLDLEMDSDHNRSVMTYVGPPSSIKIAAFLSSKKAVELIDLNYHKGTHPRIGSVDVIPFIPIKDVEMGDCIKIAREVGKEIGDKLKLPVYLYEEAALKPERRNLANIRKGEFEGLKEELGKNPDRAPDFGPNKIHPTGGAVAIGARQPLIAYNVYLNTSDVKIAKEISKKIRESSGGLPKVKALGMMVKGRAQVSMNLCDYKKTSLFTVYKTIEEECEKYQTTIHSSEIIGLLPKSAIKEEWISELKIFSFSDNQIIENRLDGD